MKWLAVIIVCLLQWPLWIAVLASFQAGQNLSTHGGDWSPRWYIEFATDSRWLMALGRTILLAGLSTLLALASSLPVVHAAWRGSQWARRLIWFSVLPMVLPSAVIGFGALALFSRLGWLHELWPLCVLHAAMMLPVAMFRLQIAYQDLSLSQVQVAQSLGANQQQVFRWVIWPQIRPALWTCAVMGVMLSMNEAMLVQFIGTPETETLSRMIWPKLRYSLSPMVAVAATVSTVCTLLLLPLLRFRTR